MDRKSTPSGKKALSNLKQVIDILDKHYYWFHGGALLGYVRDNDFLPDETDFDLAMWQEDFEKLDAKEFNKKGFSTAYVNNKLQIQKDGYDFSVATYHLKSDKAVRYFIATRNKLGVYIYGFARRIKNTFLLRTLFYIGSVTNSMRGVRKVVPAHMFLELKEIDYFGIKIKAPKDINGYLEHLYGKEWKVPIRKKAYRKHKRRRTDFYVVSNRFDKAFFGG